MIYDGSHGGDEWQRLVNLCRKALLRESQAEKSAKGLHDLLWRAKYACGLNDGDDDFIIIKDRFVSAVKNELPSATLAAAEKLEIFASLAEDATLTGLIQARLSELK